MRTVYPGGSEIRPNPGSPYRQSSSITGRRRENGPHFGPTGTGSRGCRLTRMPAHAGADAAGRRRQTVSRRPAVPVSSG